MSSLITLFQVVYRQASLFLNGLWLQEEDTFSDDKVIIEYDPGRVTSFLCLPFQF